MTASESYRLLVQREDDACFADFLRSNLRNLNELEDAEDDEGFLKRVVNSSRRLLTIQVRSGTRH